MKRLEPSLDAAGSLVCRPELEADRLFRFQLFCASRPPGEELSGLDAALREQLLQLQFVGQTATYRTQYPQAGFDIIELDGTPVGRVVTDRASKIWTIVDIAIVPSHRGRGLGAAIVRDIVETARREGAILRGSISAGNVDAWRFWSRQGFEVTARSEVLIALEWRGSR